MGNGEWEWIVLFALLYNCLKFLDHHYSFGGGDQPASGGGLADVCQQYTEA